MNPKPDQPTDLSQADIKLLADLTHLAENIEPNPLFKAQLENDLLQAHQATSHQAKPRQHLLGRYNRRLSLVAGVTLAIAALVSLPSITSGRLPHWVVSLLNSTVDTRANAQTIAQLVETGQIIVRSDVQEYNEDTQEVRAIGDALLIYSEAQIRANADEIRYVPTGRQVILSGNVQILQRGERLQGTQAVCFLEQKQCSLSDNSPSD
jgi:hypothetical protein